MPNTIYGDIAPRTAAWASTEFLKRGVPYLTIEKFGQLKPIPRNKTDTVKFRRYNALALALTALTEGVTPAGSRLTHTDVQATLSQYGDYVEITDKVIELHEDPVLKENMPVLGEQAAQTLETVRFNVLKAGTNVFYANSVAGRSSVNNAVSRADIRRVTKALQRQNCRFISSVLKSSVKYDTHNIEAAYIGLVHPDLESDIRDMTGFISAASYGTEKAMENEIGAVEHVRFVKSTIILPWTAAGAPDTGAFESTLSNNNDVYPILIVGKDAYAVVPLRGSGAVHLMVVNPQPAASDPLAQRGTIGWKSWQTAAILNDAWMARLEVAATV